MNSIDPSALNPYVEVMGMRGVIDLLDVFLSTTPELVDTLYISVSSGDAKLFSRSAHTLKSNSAIFGAQNLSQICLELETVGKSANLPDLLPRVDQLKTEYGQVCRELVELRERLTT
jgi:HPt (histidine-containing phosphotransfer) domain-containing protein